MNIKAIHHIAILTDDYERSKRFYTEVLGFEIIRETYRKERDSYKLDLSIGGKYQVELFSFPDYRERGSYPEAKGLRHLAFAVDDVDAAAAELRAKGVEVEAVRVDALTQRRFVFFIDPNGQPLELYEG
ncbi:VOC family protein [Flavitalea sp. BT771]|uniref:SMU1112c/YaeR family gloxylase I-like metalloprotein n=1 Tax=Flavitalea sp. BT771 TaxID=3063329 RepID=UPI0026E259D2|nr:VOC family protein [Flavitalea sp. BT771]MDO6434695.1 VOC family protein [Flavitalea sp. BT771]MDV6223595.1 VOC family protein [Flavitalea sp. BT771]